VHCMHKGLATTQRSSTRLIATRSTLLLSFRGPVGLESAQEIPAFLGTRELLRESQRKLRIAPRLTAEAPVWDAAAVWEPSRSRSLPGVDVAVGVVMLMRCRRCRRRCRRRRRTRTDGQLKISIEAIS